MNLDLGPPGADGRPHADAGPRPERLGRRRTTGPPSCPSTEAVRSTTTAPSSSGFWTEGGSPLASGETTSATLPVGEHRVYLTVVDDQGLSFTDYHIVRVLPFSVKLADRFAAPTIGTDWLAVDDGTVDDPSSWRLVHGSLWQTSNIYGPHHTATTGRLGTRFMWDRAPALRRGPTTPLSTTVGTTDNDGIGVVFRALGADRYKFDMDQQRNFRKLFRLAGGTEVTLAAEAQSYPLTTDLPLRVHVAGDDLSVSLAGFPPLRRPGDRHSPCWLGSIGLYCWGADYTVFEDVVVEEGCGRPWDVEALRVTGATISWEYAAFADEYDVIRGTVADLAGGSYGTCQNLNDPTLTDRSLVDPDVPSPGIVYTYLVRGRSVLCPEAGDYGKSSVGAPRAPTPGGECPPP